MADYGQSSSAPVLLGPNGAPIARVTEANLTETEMGSFDSYQASSFVFPPFNPDIWIASKGYTTLDDMLAMGAVRAPLDTLRDAIVYKGVSVQPAVNEGHDDYKEAQKIATEFEWCLNNMRDEADNVQDPRQAMQETAYAIHTGFSVAEINWRYLEDGPCKGKYGFSGLAHKNCRMIGFDVDKRTMAPRNITSYTPLDGYRFNIPVEKVIRYTYRPREGLPYGWGVGRSGYKHSWSIDFLYKFWNIALEIFGSPFILGKAAPNAIAKARQVIAEIRQGAPAILPQGVEAQIVETAGNGILGFKSAVEHHTQALAYVYLGSTLTSGEGQRSGSLALGQVHSAQQDYGFGGRRKDLEGVWRGQLAVRWVRYNYGRDKEHLTPVITLGNWDEGDTAKLASATKVLLERKVLHPAEPQIREKLGFKPARPEDMERLEAAWNAPEGPIVVNSDNPPANENGEDPQ